MFPKWISLEVWGEHIRQNNHAVEEFHFSFEIQRKKCSPPKKHLCSLLINGERAATLAVLGWTLEAGKFNRHLPRSLTWEQTMQLLLFGITELPCSPRTRNSQWFANMAPVNAFPWLTVGKALAGVKAAEISAGPTAPHG